MMMMMYGAHIHNWGQHYRDLGRHGHHYCERAHNYCAHNLYSAGHGHKCTECEHSDGFNPYKSGELDQDAHTYDEHACNSGGPA